MTQPPPNNESHYLSPTKSDISSDDNDKQKLQAIYNFAQQALSANCKNHCRKLCLELERISALPLPLRCHVYHLLAQCSGQDKILCYLDLALSLVESMEMVAEVEGKGGEECRGFKVDNARLRETLLRGEEDEMEEIRQDVQKDGDEPDVVEDRGGVKRMRAY